LYEGLDLRLPIWAAQHRALIQQQLPILLCPSASGDQQAFQVVDGASTPYSPDGVTPLLLGRSHYVANHGQESGWTECGAALTALVFTDIYTSQTATIDVYGDATRLADGPFFRNSRTRVSDVTDGLSNTIFLGEHSSRLSDKTWVGVIPGASIHPRLSTPENSPDAAATMVLVHAGPAGGELDITGFPLIHPINFPTMHVGQMYAEHPGGGNIVFGDGSVHFFSESIDLIVFAELSSMDEGEIPGEWQ
jgi:prepilin-type processing-associated H-X9-DG protein